MSSLEILQGHPSSAHFLSADDPPYSLPCGGASHPWNRNLLDLVFPSVLILHDVLFSPWNSPSMTASGASPPPATSHSLSMTSLMASSFRRSKCFSMQEYSWGGWSRQSSIANLMLYCFWANREMIFLTVFFISAMHQPMDPVASSTNRMSTRLWNSPRSSPTSLVGSSWSSFFCSSSFFSWSLASLISSIDITTQPRVCAFIVISGYSRQHIFPSKKIQNLGRMVPKFQVLEFRIIKLMSQTKMNLRERPLNRSTNKNSSKSIECPEVAQLRSALCCACDQNQMLRRKVQELEALYVEAAMKIESQQEIISKYKRLERDGRARLGKHYRSKSA